jgi:hypothetical protein
MNRSASHGSQHGYDSGQHHYHKEQYHHGYPRVIGAPMHAHVGISSSNGYDNGHISPRLPSYVAPPPNAQHNGYEGST